MTDDARLLELTWLTEIEGRRGKTLASLDDAERRLAVHCLSRGM